ncbi:MAG: OB-fold nucleic acid binding domain-containing protein, partial [Bacillota bacterium]
GWLKKHYPVQFMAAIMNSVMDSSGKIAMYIQYCRSHGIPVLPPDINHSGWRFTVGRDANGKAGIRFGMGAVKNVGRNAVLEIMKEREKAPFRDLFDFADRVPSDALNKRVAESLIKAGAFDYSGCNRAQLLSVYERVLDDAGKKHKNNLSGQVCLFDMMNPGDCVSDVAVPDMPEHSRNALLNMEKEMTGVYISGHPLDQVADWIGSGFTTAADVFSMAENEHRGIDRDGEAVTMAGILALAKNRITKKGSMMGILTLEDLTGQIEGLVFPKIYEKVADQLNADQLVILAGKLSFREDEEPKLLVDTVQPLTKQTAADVKRARKMAVLHKDTGEARGWERNPQAPFARLSDKNMQTILSYPSSSLEAEMNETLLNGVPRTL